MHIVFVSAEFVTEKKGGGLASYIANISQILASYGHYISIITLSNKRDGRLEWKEHISVYRVNNASKVSLTPLRKLMLSRRLYLC